MDFATVKAVLAAFERSPPLDLLTRLGQAFALNDLEVVRAPFEDLIVSVVSPRTLYRMKRDTGPRMDKADAALRKPNQSSRSS